MLGEVSHRMAGKLIHNRTRGFKRQAGEVFALLINPSNGLTRLLDGKWGKPPESPSLIDTTKWRRNWTSASENITSTIKMFSRTGISGLTGGSVYPTVRRVKI